MTLRTNLVQNYHWSCLHNHSIKIFHMNFVGPSSFKHACVFVCVWWTDHRMKMKKIQWVLRNYCGYVITLEIVHSIARSHTITSTIDWGFPTSALGSCPSAKRTFIIQVRHQSSSSATSNIIVHGGTFFTDHRIAHLQSSATTTMNLSTSTSAALLLLLSSP